MQRRKFCLACLGMLVIKKALAKLPPGATPGPFAEWFRAQHFQRNDSTLISCCDESEGHHIVGTDWRWYTGQQDATEDPKDSQFIWAEFQHWNKWWPIRSWNMNVWDSRTNKPTKNPTGDAIIWYREGSSALGGTDDEGRSLVIYCFVPAADS